MGRGAKRNHYGLGVKYSGAYWGDFWNSPIVLGLYPLQTVIVSTARHEGLEESLRPRVQDFGCRG